MTVRCNLEGCDLGGWIGLKETHRGWIGARSWVVEDEGWVIVTSSLAAKLWALREGLLLYIEMQAQAVVVELDAIAAISLLSNNACTNGDFFILVDDCRDMLLQLPQVQILHCFREANCCVDALARMGSDLQFLNQTNNNNNKQT
ncbi:hypothetical protein CFP56_040718 [Quercus suber]|uniref:RNase H type-1 domain-containing protein n=1 Tax=Quercus suber TaxID=58331 RepID=A0AAW0IXY6_QUESU